MYILMCIYSHGTYIYYLYIIFGVRVYWARTLTFYDKPGNGSAKFGHQTIMFFVFILTLPNMQFTKYWEWK